MLGSDWPVCELQASYGAVKRLVEDCLAGESAHARAQVFGLTAIEFYGLTLDDPPCTA